MVLDTKRQKDAPMFDKYLIDPASIANLGHTEAPTGYGFAFGATVPLLHPAKVARHVPFPFIAFCTERVRNTVREAWGRPRTENRYFTML